MDFSARLQRYRYALQCRWDSVHSVLAQQHLFLQMGQYHGGEVLLLLSAWPRERVAHACILVRATSRHYRVASCTSKIPLRHEQPISPSRFLRRGASRGSAGRSDACMTGSGTQACCCCGSSRVGKSGSTCAAQALSRLLGVCSRARRALNRSIEGRNACGVWAALVVRHGRLVLLGAPLGVDARLAVLCRRRHTALALGEVV